jgi:hypothetical protein
VLKYIIHCLLLLCFSSEVVKAQSARPRIFQGRIIDCINRQSVAYADIYNESTRKGIFADSSGFFRMPANIGDTLIIQSMGFHGKVYYILDLSSNPIDTLELCPQTYDIGVVLIDLPHTYEGFKKTFLEIEPDRGLQIEGLPKAKLQDIPSLLDTNYLNSDHFAIFSPINYLYYKYSKEEKSKRKVFYLERQKREQLLIDKKYNRELIERMTGFKGDSITDFMVFCSFSHQFLYESTELEIVAEIDKKFNEYLNRNKLLNFQDH